MCGAEGSRHLRRHKKKIQRAEGAISQNVLFKQRGHRSHPAGDHGHQYR